MKWKFFPGPERQITAVLSLCAAVLFAFLAIRSAGDTLFMYHYTKTPSYHYALGNGLVPENIPPFAEFALLHPVLLDLLQTFLLANAAVIAFGLWRGRSWGRVSAVYFLYSAALVLLSFVICPSFVVPEPYVHHGIAPFPEFNQKVRIISLVMRTAAAFFIFLFIILARYFENLSQYPENNFYLPAEDIPEENRGAKDLPAVSRTGGLQADEIHSAAEETKNGSLKEAVDRTESAAGKSGFNNETEITACIKEKEILPETVSQAEAASEKNKYEKGAAAEPVSCQTESETKSEGRTNIQPEGQKTEKPSVSSHMDSAGDIQKPDSGEKI